MNTAAAHMSPETPNKVKPFGPAERTIAMRYLRAKKSQGGVGLIAGISFACIALAIAAMIIIMSIMNGFREEVVRLTIGSEGHMFVALAEANPQPQTIDDIEVKINALPNVTKAFEFTQDFAGVQANGRVTAGQVIGMEVDALKTFDLIAGNLQLGSLDGFARNSGEDQNIIIGVQMAAQLGLTVGDKIVLLSGRVRQSPFGPPKPVYKPYRVGAIFSTGLYEADLTYIYMDIEESTILFHAGVSQGTIMIRLDDPDDVGKMRQPVRAAAGQPIFLDTWRERKASVATALRTEQIAMRLVFMIVVIIAMFPVLAAMIMLVKNKSKDIAILRTIGATSGSILRIFLMAGAMIGLLGTFIGIIGGILFCLNISAVQSFIEIFTGPLFPAETYQLAAGIPAKMVGSEVAGVAFWGFLVSALATFFPAWTASKIDPVEALRYE